ncbi:MAG TPA: polyprenyl synthetase family protein [Thermoleophilaceae bacterium]|nr:polyprenyl synthetase family protein [Thermoleophilaceae bacterium]
MKTTEQLAPVLAAGGPGLARGLRLAESRLATIAGEHGEVLAEHVGGTLAAGGKRLRPLLAFLCAGSEEPDERVVAGAAAVELLHMATLVHDDVLDRATLRRGHPTIFATAGRDAATATGDLLFSRAFAELAATGSAAAVQALSTASTALARGELIQRDDAWSAAVTPDRYRERCGLKTGSLFAASCRLGAELAARGNASADSLAAFGDRLGVAFQILDDVLDVSGPVEDTGKHRGTDLLDGTVTLPLILARERDRDLAALDLRSFATTPREAEALCDRIAATGALDLARSEALAIVDDAKRRLAAIALEPWQRSALDLVADGVVARYS